MHCIKAAESVVVIGELKGLAFTLVAETVVVEASGLITVKGQSDLFATTRMRDAFELFLVSVEKVHDNSFWFMSRKTS